MSDDKGSENLEAVREALHHAEARFECLADGFEEAGERWCAADIAMCRVDAERMRKAIAGLEHIARSAPSEKPVAWPKSVKDFVAFLKIDGTWRCDDASIDDALDDLVNRVLAATPTRPALSREEIARALREHFMATISAGRGMPFPETGVSLPSEAFNGYAGAILSAQSQATVTNGSGTANEGG